MTQMTHGSASEGDGERGRRPSAKPDDRCNAVASASAASSLLCTTLKEQETDKVTGCRVEGASGSDEALDAYRRKPLTWNCQNMAQFGGMGRKCWQWRCTGCARAVAQRDAWRISEGIRARPDGVWLFCVITCSAKRIKYYSVQKCFRDWDTNFKKVARKLKAELISTDAQIIQVMEQTARGYPHSNCLVFVPHAVAAKHPKIEKKTKIFLKKNLPKLGFGFMTSVSKVDERTMPALTKYVTKAIGKCEAKTLGVALEASKAGNQLPIFMPRLGRRIRTSPGVLPTPKEYFAFVALEMQKGKSEAELSESKKNFEEKKQERITRYGAIQAAKNRNQREVIDARVESLMHRFSSDGAFSCPAFDRKFEARKKKEEERQALLAEMTPQERQKRSEEIFARLAQNKNTWLLQELRRAETTTTISTKNKDEMRERLRHDLDEIDGTF